MKFSIFLFFSFMPFLSSMEMEKWAEKVSKVAAHALFEYVKSSGNHYENLKEFEKNKETAGPFLFPVNDISAVQGNKVKSSGEEFEFAKKGLKSKNNTGSYNVIRYTANLESATDAIVQVNGGAQFRIYINGRYMDQLLNGLVYERNSTAYTVKLQKGRNEFVVFPAKSKTLNTGLSFVPVSPDAQENFKRFLIEKYTTLDDKNRDSFIGLIDHICESQDTEITASAVVRLIKTFEMKKDDWGYVNALRKTLNGEVFSAVSQNLQKEGHTDKLAAAMVKADLHSITGRLSNLILNEKTDYVEEFLFKALALCTTDKMIKDFRNNLYEAGKMFKYCGKYAAANRILGKYRTVMNVKDEHHFKEVEALFIETSDPGKVRPRFVGDPETDHLKREVDSLLAEAPGKEAYQRLLRLFRNKGHQLFEDSDRKLSLRAYLASSLKTKAEYAQGFASYLKGRYQEDVNEAVRKSAVDELEKILSEVEGLSTFPEARKFLMQEYYNRGEIRKALRDACFLLKYGHEESLAAAYILILEDRLSIPQNSRVSLPEHLLTSSVKIAGQETTISSLLSKYRTKAFKTSSKGPGSLLTQFELAEVSYGSFESYDSDKKTGTLKLNRQPLESNFYNGRWISSSPYGIKVFDQQGKALWGAKKPVKEAEAREASIPRQYQSKVIENIIYNLEYSEGSTHLELIARDLSGREVWSTQTLRGFEKWEPCSLPYSKFNTAVLLVMEKQRTTSPVIGIAFIDLESGSLNKIVPISRTRDPFSHDRRYSDISNVARFHDRFTSDEESIYLYTGSGQIIKVNALEENISWVAGYHFRLAGIGHHFSMNLSRAAAAAPGFISKNGNKIIHFNPARIGWFIINDQDGSVEWKNFTQIPNYIHSRGTPEVIFSTGSDERRNLLVRMDPQSGKRMWMQDLLGIRVTGEGVFTNGKLYIPSVEGIAEFDGEDGSLLKISPLNEIPTKVQRIDDSWLIQSRFNAFVFKSGDQLTANIKDRQQAAAIETVKMDKTDSRFWSLETAVEFPFNFSLKDRDEVREIFKTSKPGHYIIRIGNDVALFRESSYENKRYTPPKVIWSNSIKDFDVVQDKLLIRYEDRVEVFNVLTRRNLFVYEAGQGMSEILSGMSKISMARLCNDKIYILTAGQELLQYDLNTNGLLNKYRLSATDFSIFGNKLIALASKSGKYKTSLYELNGSLKLIQEYKEKISSPHLAADNGKYFGCFSGERLYVLNQENNELQAFSTSKNKTGWQLIGDYAAVSPNILINLREGKQQTVKGVYLCENGGAVIIEKDDKVTYISDKGQTQLENADKKFYFSTYDPVKQIRDFGRGSDYNDQLILGSHEGERVYSLKDGRLLAARTWARGERNSQFLYTEKSRLVMKADKAFVFSDLGRKMPLNRLYESDEEIDALSWVKLNTDSWVDINNSSPPEAEYRYSETSDKVTVQVRIKGALRQINGLAVSFNEKDTEEYVFAEMIEGRSTFISVSGHLLTDEKKNHYFDENAYEYLQIELEKEQLVNITHRPAVQIEIATFKNSEKTGFYRIGGSYAPGAYNLNLNGASTVENSTAGRFKDLSELYSSASCLMADGLALSQFITRRRSAKGVDDNISYLEEMLKKHKENLSAIGILTSLFLERAHKQKKSGKTDDSSLISISKQCRAFASSLNMKKEWIDYALTVLDLEILKDLNHRNHPYKIGLKGEGEIFIPLDGTVQVSAEDGRVLLAPGLFNRSYVYKIKELEFRMNKYSATLGEFKLLRDDKITPIADSKGDPKSEFAESRWKDSIRKILYFGEKSVQEAYSLDSKNTRLYIKEIVLPRIEASYKWDGNSLLANMKLNPVSEWQATDMLRKWIEINKVSDEKLQDILVEVMTYNTDNYNLIYSVCKIFMEKAGDLELVKNILRKAKIQINYRRRIFLEFSSMKGWDELGPVYAAEDVENPRFDPLPERSRLTQIKDFTDTNGNKFKFKAVESSKNKNSGLVYFKSEFESKNAAKAYLHISNNGHDGYGVYTIWFNGRKMTEGSFKRWKWNQESTLLECRPGTNTILVKYEFIRSKDFKINIGDLYGAPVSYLK